MVETIADRLTDAWARTDRIFEILEPGSWLAQPIALRHPFIFYLGHLPAFAWNHVSGGVLERPAFNAAFDELFSRGIDPDVDDPTHCHDHPEVPDRWPAVAEVVAYRDRVREALLASVDAVAARAETHLMAREGRVFSMVIEHEYMHQETLLYMLQRLALERKVRPAWLPPYVLGPGRPAGPVEIPAGPTTVGARFDELPFGWDNEFSALEVHVPAFSMDATAVTNRQFQAFVEDGGYQRADLWTDEDWVWRGHDAVEHPAVWELVDGAWVYLTMFDRLPLAQVADWPVYVSLAEARAFARWRGGRLPSEAEFHRAAIGPSKGGRPEDGNVGFRHWAPTPVGTHPDSASVWGVQDLVGDGWEWTGTVFAGLPGFTTVHPGLRGLLGRFLRRQALRAEGRLVGHRRPAGAPELPQLVPGALPIRVRQVPLRHGWLTDLEESSACGEVCS